MTATIHSADEAPDDEVPHPDTSTVATADTGSITRQGVRQIVRFVRMHPVPFALSLVGGVAWALMVVTAAWLFGKVTDDVIEPAFAGGVEASTVWMAVAALFLVGLLRGVAVVVRRWYGSVTEARMQRSLRTSVVDRLLTMPMSSYRRRPTGELLSNAEVDVTTATQMLMPLPFSLGVIALIGISLFSLVRADGVFDSSWVSSVRSLTRVSTARWSSRRSAWRPLNRNASRPRPASSATRPWASPGCRPRSSR